MRVYECVHVCGVTKAAGASWVLSLHDDAGGGGPVVLEGAVPFNHRAPANNAWVAANSNLLGPPHVRPIGVHRMCSGPNDINKPTHADLIPPPLKEKGVGVQGLVVGGPGKATDEELVLVAGAAATAAACQYETPNQKTSSSLIFRIDYIQKKARQVVRKARRGRAGRGVHVIST